MKKAILFVIGPLFCSSMLLAQSYQPFPTSNAYWIEGSKGYQSTCSDFQYEIKGDTVINSVTYHKVYQSGVRYFRDNSGCNTNIVIDEYQEVYYAAIRNDIPNKKIYGWTALSGVEELFYDFDLDIGQNLPATYFTDATNQYKVMEIDSIEIDGVYHKRFHIDNCGNNDYMYLIEGIGSSYGFFWGYGCTSLSGQVHILHCFSVDSKAIYPNTSTPCEKLDLSVHSNSLMQSVNIFPNPATEKIQISLEASYGGITSVVMVNTMGVVVYKGELKNNSIEIDVQHLPTGIYITSLTVGNQVVQKKVLKF